MRVEVYRNLHTGNWSVRDVRTGLVVRHAEEVVVFDAHLVVRPAGRERVRKEGRKNVHAFVRGMLGGTFDEPVDQEPSGERVRYNPYVNDTFVLEDGTPVSTASTVELLADGKVFAEFPA